MKKILLISFFKSANVGDQAICSILASRLSEIAHVEEMDVSGKPMESHPVPQPEGENRIILHQRCRFYNLKYMVSLRMPGRMEYAKACIDRCDMVVIAGGNMIMDLEKFSLYSFLCGQYIKYAKRKGKKTAVLFVGVGKIRNRIQKARWHRALQGCDMISVRDSRSRERMHRELKVKKDISIWRDPVFALENKKEPQGHKAVAVNIYLDALKQPEEKEQLKQAYLHIIHELKKEYEIMLYSTEKLDNAGLYEVYETIADKTNVKLCWIDTADDLLALYRAADAVVATRMHAFIIALTQNIPTMALAWDMKLHGMIEDLGLTQFKVRAEEAFAQRNVIVEQVRGYVQDREKYAEFIGEIQQKNRKDFACHIQTIRSILEE